jgi:hypothetical protein
MLQFTPAEAPSLVTVAVKPVVWPEERLLLCAETLIVTGFTVIETELVFAGLVLEVPVTVAVQLDANGAGAT